MSAAERFEAWWQAEGQHCRAGGGDYEKTFAYHAFQEANRQAMNGAAKICEEVRQGISAMRDTALSEGDSTMAAAHNAAAIVVRDLGSEFRAASENQG